MAEMNLKSDLSQFQSLRVFTTPYCKHMSLEFFKKALKIGVL